jgi:hypothetical protein
MFRIVSCLSSLLALFSLTLSLSLSLSLSRLRQVSMLDAAKSLQSALEASYVVGGTDEPLPAQSVDGVPVYR